jgi:hypothetical protein
MHASSRVVAIASFFISRDENWRVLMAYYVVESSDIAI